MVHQSARPLFIFGGIDFLVPLDVQQQVILRNRWQFPFLDDRIYQATAYNHAQKDTPCQ